MGTVVFFLSTSLALLASFFLAAAAFRDADAWRRNLAAVAGFPLVVTAILLFLAPFSAIRALWLLAGTTIVCAGSAMLWRKTQQTGRLTSLPPSNGSSPSAVQATDIAIVLLAAVLLPIMVRGAFSGPSFSVDDLGYHAPPVAYWMQQGDLSLPPCDYSAYYPFNAELLNLWFMAPVMNDALAGLAGVYWVLLAVTAVHAITVSHGRPQWTGVLAAALVVGSSVVVLEARRFSANNLAGTSLILAAAAMVFPPRQSSRGSPKPWGAAYAGLLAGLAVGTKISFAAPAAVVGVWLLVNPTVTERLSSRLQWTFLFGACALAAGGFWYIRNAVLTGNPLFPAEVGPFNGPFGKPEQFRTELIGYLMDRPTDPGLWKNLAAWYTDWPVGLFLVSLAGYAAAIPSLFTRRPGSWDEVTWHRLLLLMIGIAAVFSFPFQPFSGTDDAPDAVLRNGSRLILLAFAVGVPLLAVTADRWAYGLPAFLLLGSGALVTSYAERPEFALLLIPVAVGLVWFRASKARAEQVRRHSALIKTASVTLFLLLVTLLHPRIQRSVNGRLASYGGEEQPVGKGWAALTTLPPGSRVAWLGKASYVSYPFYGRDFSLQPVYVNPDGTRAGDLHDLWQGGGTTFDWWGERGDPNSPSLLRNLRESGAEFVFVSKWDDVQWPPQYEMLASAGWGKLYDDGYSALFDVP